jgi:hypothetical protein
LVVCGNVLQHQDIFGRSVFIRKFMGKKNPPGSAVGFLDDVLTLVGV